MLPNPYSTHYSGRVPCLIKELNQFTEKHCDLVVRALITDDAEGPRFKTACAQNFFFKTLCFPSGQCLPVSLRAAKDESVEEEEWYPTVAGTSWLSNGHFPHTAPFTFNAVPRAWPLCIVTPNFLNTNHSGRVPCLRLIETHGRFNSLNG